MNASSSDTAHMQYTTPDAPTPINASVDVPTPGTTETSGTSRCTCTPPPSGVLPFDRLSGTWEERTAEKFTAAGSSEFTGITATELIGKCGTSTAFDLRYFEIEPGGYSPFEKHRHEHVIIGVRGTGFLIKGRKRVAIHPHDIGYVAPLEPHQLQNPSDQPFGFYCIVDHQRDMSQPLDSDDE